ncbi:hypothetical protein ALC60_02383 [Trachymyrmex zeteki]|uniref:Uncharacterized protein n=1 Tax=Mycetomoellerius zeteki TaxID=64791 RepID=A0A151XEE5_9HYME|nr:hypothetical protein ALC60_02383 [Trachymyrmex zeteki]
MLYYLTVNDRHSDFQYCLTTYNIEQTTLKNSGVLKNDSVWGIGSDTNAVVFRVATRHSVVRVHCGDAGFNAPLPTILSELALENF